ncbi:MAG: DUF2752 domain-containing protein [Isosphaeraceae bacterium]
MSLNAPDDRLSEEISKLSVGTRVLLATAALGIAMGFLVASRLEPDPKGFGTHEQMGLPPCAFLKVTRLPCPSCGLTTSFAWITRGRFDQAWRANPAGLLLAPLCAWTAVWCCLSALFGRPARSKSVDGPLTFIAVLGVSVSLLTWTLRLLLRR